MKVISAAIILFLVGTGRVSAAEVHPPCRPTVRLEGEMETVTAIKARLEERGVDTSGPGECGELAVRVVRTENQFHLKARDQFGRSQIREVAGEALAAVLIESWTLVEINAPEALPFQELTPPPLTESEFLALGKRGKIESPRTLAGQLSLEVSLGSDSSQWLGAAVSGCIHFGSNCGGPLFRFAVDRIGLHSTRDLSRSTVEMLMDVERSLQLGRTRLSLGGGIGIGWLTTTRFVNDDRITVDDGEMRAELRVRTGRSIRAGLSATFDLSVEAWAFARTAAVIEDGVELPEEPAILFRMGLGMQFGEQ